MAVKQKCSNSVASMKALLPTHLPSSIIAQVTKNLNFENFFVPLEGTANETLVSTF